MCADERPPLALGHEFVGTEVEQAIDGVAHEQALDFFLGLSPRELRARQELARQQIATAWHERSAGHSIARMDAAVLRLQATEALLTRAVLLKTQPSSPWHNLQRETMAGLRRRGPRSSYDF